MTVTVRLDAKTESLLERLAKKRGQSKSALVREAINSLAPKLTGESRKESFYDRISHLIGCVELNDPTLSENTGERFRKIVEEKHRGRRAR